jgi:hypothetical protein
LPNFHVCDRTVSYVEVILAFLDLLVFKIYRTIILPVILYGCKTSSLSLLREERRLKVFENRALRKLFGPKTDEVTGVRRKLHNEELNDLYCSPNIFRVIKSRMRFGGACSAYGEKDRCVQSFGGET